MSVQEPFHDLEANGKMSEKEEKIKAQSAQTTTKIEINKFIYIPFHQHAIQLLLLLLLLAFFISLRSVMLFTCT